VVICGGFLPELADRLARAGFAVVSFDMADSTAVSQVQDLDVVLDALRRGTVGVAAETYGLMGHDAGAAIALLRSAGDERVRALVTVATSARLGGGDEAVRERWLEIPGSNAAAEEVVRASIEWLARYLA
jgi:pimeloyl-ACP methyl ester carboxylesterase